MFLETEMMRNMESLVTMLLSADCRLVSLFLSVPLLKVNAGVALDACTYVFL